MPSFPALSTPPNYPLREIIEDRALKGKSEAGYVSTRYKYTRQTVSFEVLYSMLTDADRDLLRDFYDEVETVDSFTWVNPYTNVSYTVRFDSVPTFDLVDNDKHECKFLLRQI